MSHRGATPNVDHNLAIYQGKTLRTKYVLKCAVKRLVLHPREK